MANVIYQIQVCVLFLIICEGSLKLENTNSTNHSIEPSEWQYFYFESETQSLKFQMTLLKGSGVIILQSSDRIPSFESFSSAMVIDADNPQIIFNASASGIVNFIGVYGLCCTSSVIKFRDESENAISTLTCNIFLSLLYEAKCFLLVKVITSVIGGFFVVVVICFLFAKFCNRGNLRMQGARQFRRIEDQEDHSNFSIEVERLQNVDVPSPSPLH